MEVSFLSHTEDCSVQLTTWVTVERSCNNLLITFHELIRVFKKKIDLQPATKRNHHLNYLI